MSSRSRIRHKRPGALAIVAGALAISIAATGAHFPKFVLDLSTHLSRTSESHGHRQTFVAGAAFLFDVPGSNLPLVVQERQIGGTSVAAVLGSSLMVDIPAGDYVPFFQESPGKGKARVESTAVKMRPFRLDALPVTNGQYLDFVREHGEWRRSRIKPLFADQNYLAHWRGDLELEDAKAASAPVTNVSWFAAEAYCEARGLKLPLTEQWEYALADRGRRQTEVEQQSLDWFSAPNPKRLAAVGQSQPNGYGVYDLVGLVWEWTLDASSFMTGTEQRNTSSKDDAMFCGGGSIGVTDAANYPAFMRYAMRSSLKASYTVENVGFRCEGDE